MNPWRQTRAEREAAIARLDVQLRADPLSIGLALDRARLLAELDRDDEARDDYLRLLAREPDHPRALNDFGTFLLQRGFHPVGVSNVADQCHGSKKSVDPPRQVTVLRVKNANGSHPHAATTS